MPNTPRRYVLLSAAVLSAALPAVVAGPYPYGRDDIFHGEATFFDIGDNVGGGNCALRGTLPKVYDGLIPVALNNDQYGDSLLCGACIEGVASGEGSGTTPLVGTFNAFVTDRCPECSFGDLDFGMDGDGRWEISWRFVKCPVKGRNDPSFIFEGSNEWYWKIQARGTKTPVKKLWVNGVKAERTQDNFFVISQGPYEGEQLVKTKTIRNKRKKQMVAL